MKKINYIYMCLMALLLTTYSCKEDESGMNVAPTIQLLEVDTTTIYRTGATLTANIQNADNRSISESGFIISTSRDFESMTLDNIRTSSTAQLLSLTDSAANKATINYNVSSLEANTTYYYQAFISSGFSSVRSDILSFTTTATNEPKFSELTFSNIGLSSCTVTFELLDLGGEDKIASLEFWYKKVGADEQVASLTREECEVEDASAYVKTINGLERNTRYAICVHALTDASRTATGKVYYFTTANYSASISNVKTTVNGYNIQVTATVTTNETVTAEGVFYSQENATPNENNIIVSDNTVDKSINVNIENIAAGKYYIRPYAKIQKDGSSFFVYSDQVEIVTVNVVPDAAPIFGSCTVEDTTSSSITLSSSVQAMGESPIKERGFCYVEGNGTPTTANYTVAVSTGKPFTATIYELKADTEYSVRAYAINEQGTTGYSSIIKVKTLKNSPNTDDNVFPGVNQ